jgi:uncharacterized protein (TIGR00251 family)
VNLLNWIFLTELLFLFCGWVIWIAGKMVAKSTPNDTIYQFACIFWRTMRNRPPPLKEVIPDADDPGLEGDEDSLIDSLVDNQEKPPDKMDVPATPGLRMATINVKVVPHASRDQVCGFLGKSLKVQVMAPAEAGQANKAVIDLLSSTLGLKAHQIQLVRGHYQEQKVLQIAGITQQELDARLASFQ